MRKLPWAIALLIFAFTALTDTIATAASYSFAKSCTGITQQGSIIQAVCRARHGVMVRTEIDSAGCIGDISNNIGQLVCARAGSIAPGGAVGFGREIEAGPIWNDGDANGKCPAVCGRAGLQWAGPWRTTVPGVMSVCTCGAGGAPYPAAMAPERHNVTQCSALPTKACGGCSARCIDQQAECKQGDDSLGGGCFVPASCRCR